MTGEIARAGRTADFAALYPPPVPIRLGNALLGLMPRRRMTSGRLIDAARRQTGLHALGEEFFVEALDVLLRSIEEEARLTPVGRLIQKKRITDLLANRLRLEAEMACSPEALAQPVHPTVVIAGLQRTGTTLLHRLLASHPEVRSLASWEGLSPGLLPGDDGEEKRRKVARTAASGLRYIAPDFFAIHPIEVDAQEEDVLLLELSFMSQTSEAIMEVPSYSRWLEGQDHAPAYRYMAKVLKLFQKRDAERGQPKKHWVLKSPNHLEWLDVIFDELPDAQVVQTHRSPIETVASFCSMVAHGRAVFSSAVDASEVGTHWLRKIGRLVERSLVSRSDREERFVDISYPALVADPVGVVAALHDRLGWNRSVEVDTRLSQVLSRSRKDKFGRHAYRLEDFGLDNAAVRKSLPVYMERHGF